MKNNSKSTFELLGAKNSSKNTQYSKNDNISKIARIGHHAKSKHLQNRHFGSKIKIVKKMRKTSLEAHSSCCVQKNCCKKRLIFEKWEHFQNDQN